MKPKPAQTFSSSLSSVPSSLRSQMSTRQDRDEEVLSAGKARMALTQTINDVFPQLLDTCPIHFATIGVLQICRGTCNLISMTSYRDFRNSFVFEKFTYCFKCGTPNDKKRHHYYAPPFHNQEWYKGADCPYAHFLFKAIYALWFREDLRPAFCQDLGIQATSEEEFTEWAILAPTGLTETTYFNGMTLMLWYCRHVGLVKNT